MKIFDCHSHWATDKGYLFRTAAERAQQEKIWRTPFRLFTEDEQAGKTTAWRAVAGAALLFAAAGIASGQAYPAKPIRVVVPFPPAGGVDTVARILAPKLTERLGQPTVIDNRVGAAGNIGTDLVAKAPPDGYTLLMIFTSHAINATLYRELPYDPVNDFAAVTMIATVPNILVVNLALGVKSVKELVQLAKSKPGQINYASAGSGLPAHLAAELFKTVAGVDLVHVPYKGAAPSMIGLLAGESHLTFTTVLLALPYVKAGRLRALAVTSARRSPTMPDVPTIAEAGLAGSESTSWYGLLAPARTPAEIVAQLHGELVRILKLPDIREKFLAQGAEPVGNTPEQFGAIIKSEIEKWGKVVRATGAKVD